MYENDYLLPFIKKFRGEGEWVYRLPQKLLFPHWHFTPKDINEYAVFRSFALLLYYQKETNLPLKSEDFDRYVGDFPRRPFKGVYYTIDEELHPIVIILDYYRPVKKLVEMIGSLRLPMSPERSPYFHILTNKNRVELMTAIEEKYEYEQVQAFSFEELKKLY
jgi:hypothetical protein